MEQKVLRVDIGFDDEAKVWYVCNSDVPGLAAEAATEDALVELLQVRVPELLELNRSELPRQSPWQRRMDAVSGHSLGRRFVELDVQTHRRLSVACG